MKSVDECTVQQVNEFDGKKLQYTTKEGLDLGDEDEKKNMRSSQPSSSH